MILSGVAVCPDDFWLWYIAPAYCFHKNISSESDNTRICLSVSEDDNTIEHGDLRTAKPELCQNYAEECKSLQCPYGVSRSYDAYGCQRCNCEDPCQAYHCPEGSNCAVDIQPDRRLGTTFVPVCRSSKLTS